MDHKDLFLLALYVQLWVIKVMGLFLLNIYIPIYCSEHQVQ